MWENHGFHVHLLRARPRSPWDASVTTSATAQAPPRLREAVLTFPGSPYRLHQPFAPAGDQPEAITKLVEGISDGLAFQTLLGVTGSGKTYTMAHVIARLGRPALILEIGRAHV